MRRWIEDQILRFIQKRCEHPGEMVAANILEGCAPGIEVKYCRRCGAIKTDWAPGHSDRRFICLQHWWQSPNPNLWRGR